MAPTSRPIYPWFAKIFLGSLIALTVIGARCGYAGAVNQDPQIEYIAPDGKFCSLSAANSAAHKSTAAFVDSETVSCALKEGETTFIIELPKNSPRDRLTFLNENAAACGELRIAVSDSPLPVDSSKWVQVDGIVPFAHKRLFKLSILGVETKFVRLSFRVDGQSEKSASISNPFRASILGETINSHFAKLRGQGRELDLASMSVAPLPAVASR
jgi:hypothetical protein